jgi:prolyl oligopeptidase
MTTADHATMRIVSWALAAMLGTAGCSPDSSVPFTEKAASAPVRVVTDTLFGVATADPYRWMEQPDNPEFVEWMSAQGRYTEAYLAAIPGRADLLRRIRELVLRTSTVTRVKRAGGSLFFLRADTGALMPKLFVRTTNGAERVLFDPAQSTDAQQRPKSVDNFTPSPNGRLIAFNVAEGGGEITRVHVLDVATGAARPDIIERIWGEFAVSWLPDGSGFFYTQMLEAGFKDPNVDRMLGMRARLHRLGTPPDQDPVILGPGVSNRMALDAREFPIVTVPEGSDWVVANAGGARAEYRLCVVRLTQLRDAQTPWNCVARYEDLVESDAVHGDHLYLLTSKDAPNRRIVRVPLTRPDLASAEVIVPDRQDLVLTGLRGARDALYVKEMVRGTDHVRRIPYGATSAEEVAVPLTEPSVELEATPNQDGIIVSAQTWTHPLTWYTFDPQARTVRDLELGSASPADFSRIVIESVDVKSFDGVKVPLTIVRRRDLRLNGNNPAILAGYGGYGFVIPHFFAPSLLPWLERGGIFAIAGVRGGGEKGRAWYLAGQGANKPNGIRDFIACAQYLSEKRYTAPSRLAAHGGSMGGVLVGGAITERPDAFGAAIIEVGILNTVRFLQGANGANQIAELGSPETEAGFRSLLAMDPYHRIKDGVRYPAVMLSVGLNDGRVSSWHSGKFAARLQAASSSDKPVLMRIEPEAGHGVGSTRDQEVALRADMSAFLLQQFGHREFQPRGR